MNLNKIEEYKDFLIDQRINSNMIIISEDKEFSKRQKRMQERKEKLENVVLI